jgi:hypothetical protein
MLEGAVGAGLYSLLTLPFIALLRREFARRGMHIDLAGRGT